MVIIIALTTIAWGLVLVVGELMGVLPLTVTELCIADRLFQQSGSFIVTGILLSSAVKTLHQTYITRSTTLPPHYTTPQRLYRVIAPRAIRPYTKFNRESSQRRL